MKITRRRALELYSILSNVEYLDPISNRFRYMLSINTRKLKEEVDAIQAAYPEPEAWVNTMRERAEILQRYALKTPNEIPGIADEAKRTQAQSDWTNFMTTAKVAEAEYIKFESDRKAFMDEAIEYDLVKINVDLVPKYQHPEWNEWEIWDILMTIIEEK